MLDETALAHPVSASQIADYELCQRKWGFNKLDRHPKKANKYAKRGTDVHEFLEDYSQEKPVDFDTEIGKMVAPGLKFLPAPGTAHTERNFRFETDTAVYVGKIDLSQYKEMWVYIIDHKTTSDFKWLKHIDKLKVDIQSNLYAVAAIALTLALHDTRPQDIEVKMAWVYYRANPKRPAARKVQLHVLPDGAPKPERPKDVRSEHFGVMTHGELEERFAHIERVAAEMLDHHRQGRKAKDLPMDLRGCNAFGGCGYRGDPCKLGIRELVGAHMANEDLVKRMKAAAAKQKGEKPPEEAATTTAVPATDAAAEPGDKPLSAAERIRANVKGNGASTAKPSAEAKEADAAEAAAASASKDTPPAVNPPAAAAASTQGERVSGRLRMAGNIASGLVQARLYVHTEPNYAEQIAHQSLEIADAIIEASKK